MLLVCSACNGQHELDEQQLADLETDLEGRYRCPRCNAHSTRVLASVPGASPDMPLVPPLQDLGEPQDDGWAGRPLRLRRGDKEFEIRDLDRLRRLVVERRAAGTDLVSADGVRWVPLESIPALEPYLRVVRFLDSKPRTGGGGGVLVEASSAEDGWGDPAHDGEDREP